MNSLVASLIYYGAAMLTLALFWLYKRHVFRQDRRRQQHSETDLQALALRLYLFAFAAVSLAMTSSALVLLLRWLLYQWGDGAAVGNGLLNNGIAPQANLSGQAVEQICLILKMPINGPPVSPGRFGQSQPGWW